MKAPVQDKNLAPHIVIEPVMFGPNITGEVDGILGTGTKQEKAFANSDYANKNHAGQDLGNQTVYGTINFDASLANSIYSKTSTVQPESNQTLIIIKT